MKNIVFGLAAAVTLTAWSGFAAGRQCVYGDVPDGKHAWAVHDWNRPKPAKVEPGAYVKTGAPSDAIVLFDGTKESFEKNWCDKDGKPSLWRIGDEGDFYCVPGWKNGGIVRTREEFGDCQRQAGAVYAEKGDLISLRNQLDTLIKAGVVPQS